MFLRLQPVFWKYVGALRKEGFDREESYDAVFDAIMYRCQSNKWVKNEHMFFDARRILLRKMGFHFGKKINISESRVGQLKEEMLSDLKQTLEGKYGRGYSKFPSKR